ncbi:MAG: Ig-like domain-containing protein [Deltaproteobacteria bacterium]|nr:Ig-like domain-containing protein [Deltaproteobacteria bacterium]
MPTNSASTVAIFAPDAANPCASKVPYPTDLAKDPQTGKIGIPFCPGDDDTTNAIRAGLRTLDGWAVTTALYADFSNAIDMTTFDGAVMLADLASGSTIPIRGSFDAAKGRLYIFPTAPLKEKTRYLAVITGALLDANGNKIVSDQVFTLLKSRSSFIDANNYSKYPALPDADANALEPLRLLFENLFDNVLARPPFNQERDDILVAWSFTTQSVERQLKSLEALVTTAGGAAIHYENTAVAATHPLLVAAGIPTTHLCRVHTGRIDLKTVLDAEGGVPSAYLDYLFTYNGTVPPTLAAAVASDPVDYMLVTPKGAATTCGDLASADPWAFGKVALYVHGLGRCKNDALALADTLATLGFATLSLDGPRAGSRMVGGLGDQDLDGCPDQPAAPEIVRLGDDSPSPFGIRDRIWEWGLEVSQAAEAIKTGSASFLGSSTQPATAPVVAVVGHSWGGMAAVLAGAVSPDVNLVAVHATSADLTTMLQPVLAGGLAEQMIAAGLDITRDPGKALYDQKLSDTMVAFGWGMEPADPRFAALLFPAHTPAVPTLVQIVTSGDAAALLPDAPMHAATTQTLLATTLGVNAANTTFPMSCAGAGAAQPICDTPEAVVGAMLKPCVEDTGSTLFPLAYAKLTAMRTQLGGFLASSGVTITPTDSAATCP